jgi:hypothetical protein
MINPGQGVRASPGRQTPEIYRVGKDCLIRSLKTHCIGKAVGCDPPQAGGYLNKIGTVRAEVVDGPKVADGISSRTVRKASIDKAELYARLWGVRADGRAAG